MAGMDEYNMKNWNLSRILNTPLGVVITLAAAIFCVELLFMVLLHISFRPIFGLSGVTWNIIDAISLTIIIAPLLYWLVFRKIKESEDYLRQINAAAQDAIVVIDEQGLVADWNLAAQKMFQYSREEALGQQLHRLIVTPRFRNDVVYGFARFQMNGEGPLIGKVSEVTAIRKDGSEILAELSISAVKVRGGWHAIGIIRDITERKRAEEVVTKAREKFQILFNMISDAIFVVDMNGRFIHVNRSACDRLGYSYEEMLQLSPADIDTSEYAAKIPERIKTILEQGKLVFETAHVHKDGVLAQVELNSRLIEYDGKPAILSVARDITGRKRMEIVLQQARETAELALAEQRQLVAMISHEYRSPLAVIDSATQLLSIKLAAESDTTHIIARIRRGVFRLTNFLDNCLIEGRMDSDALTLRSSAIDLHALAASVMENTQLISENHRLITELDPDIPLLDADPQLLGILLLNLLGNAIKYSPPWSEVRLRIRHTGQACSFEVIDHGCGIPADELPFIFKKYMRGRSVTSIPGAGLGLSLVSRIAALHGGRVEMESREGEGAHVTVTIPLNFATDREEQLQIS